MARTILIGLAMQPNRTGQIAVIFTSWRTAKDAQGYASAATAMEALAAMQPGYCGIESARGADGFGISVSYWSDEDCAKAWKQIAEHSAVQSLGRKQWYSSYAVQIATIGRSYAWPDNG